MPTWEEQVAADATRKLRLPSHVANYVATARREGHDLVSQGCALFRCIKCNQHAFMDEPNHLTYYACKSK